jgi:flagellar hook-length control protein FliK
MSSDLTTSALGASNKAVMQKYTANKTSNDQFAKVFANNEAYAANQNQLAQKLAPEHRHSVDAYDNRSTSEPREPTKVKYSGLRDVPRGNETRGNEPREPAPAQDLPKADELQASTSTATTSSQEKPAKKTDNSNLNEAKTVDCNITPLPQTIAPTLVDVQIALASTALNNATSNIWTSSPQTLNPQTMGELTQITPDIGANIAKASIANELNGLGQKTKNNTLLEAFSDPSLAANNRLSNKSDMFDGLFNELSQFSGKSDFNTDDILIANFKSAIDAIKTANPTDAALQKAGIIGALTGGADKPATIKTSDIFKANVNANAELILTQPFGALLNNISHVNKAANKASVSTNDISATLSSLPVAIASRALKGAREFTIHLHPAELGKVEVKMEVNDRGEIKAKLSVERVETLALLQRDSSSLQRSLEQAGFKTSSDSLQFSLSQDNGSKHQHAHMHSAQHKHKANFTDEANTVDVTAAVMNAYARRSNSALDIHI